MQMERPGIGAQQSKTSEAGRRDKTISRRDPLYRSRTRSTSKAGSVTSDRRNGRRRRRRKRRRRAVTRRGWREKYLRILVRVHGYTKPLVRRIFFRLTAVDVATGEARHLPILEQNATRQLLGMSEERRPRRRRIRFSIVSWDRGVDAIN